MLPLLEGLNPDRSTKSLLPSFEPPLLSCSSNLEDSARSSKIVENHLILDTWPALITARYAKLFPTPAKNDNAKWPMV